VRWIDPAPAVARRVIELVGPATGETHNELAPAVFTSGKTASAEFAAALQGFGLVPASAAPSPAV
jgi:glutamate racemase